MGNTITPLRKKTNNWGGRGCRMKAIRAEELLDRKISRFNGIKVTNRSSELLAQKYLGEVRGTKHENAIAKIRNESCVDKQKVLKQTTLRYFKWGWR